jgi:hypothetical protein
MRASPVGAFALSAGIYLSRVAEGGPNLGNAVKGRVKGACAETREQKQGSESAARAQHGSTLVFNGAKSRGMMELSLCAR